MSSVILHRRVSIAILVTAALMLLAASPALAWTQVPFPEYTGINSMTAADPTHVWASTDVGVFMYDGSDWTMQTSFPARSISAVDTSHVWGVGENGRIFFYNGRTWKQQISHTTDYINSVSALDAEHVWAVTGEYWTPGSGGDVLFFDGADWTRTSVSAEGLSCVHALDENHVWAAGPDGIIMFWNGSSWRKQATGTEYTLGTLYAADASHVWAAGGKGTGGPGSIFFFNGSGWSEQWTNRGAPSAPGNVCGLGGLDPEHVWAVGELGIMLFYDGAGWSEQYSGKPGEALFNVCALDRNHIWVGGNSGVILFDSPGMNNYYFAEGCTREGFDEWLCLQNAGGEAVEVTATYMIFGGAPVEKKYSLDPTSRKSINVNQEVGPGRDVAVKLESENEFYAERPMYFNYKQAVPGFGWTGGHCAKGVTAPGTDWYFAEGTTRAGFEEWICIQNPNDAKVEATVDYIFAGAYTQQKKYPIDENSRVSVFVNGDVGPDQDLSVHVHCDQPIVAERPMYFDYHGKWTGGSDVAGTDLPKTKWYFAEGTTRNGFEEYLAVQNPNGEDATLTVRFLKTDGTEVTGSEKVSANSRWTLNTNEKLGAGVDSSIVVESTLPVVAERPMYFSYGPGWTGGHDVIGSPVTKHTWFFAEGCTLDNFDEYICVGNPGDAPGVVTLEFMLGTGKTVEKEVEVGAKTRATVKVADLVGRGQDVSTKVTSTVPVIAERPMYFNYNWAWTGGHDVVGF
jgi:hypothetical protein